MRFLTSFLSLSTTVLAILPITQQRFISKTHSFQVSSVRDIPQDFEQPNDSSSLSLSSTASTNNKGSLSRSSFSNSTSTVLNLIPGLSLLQTDQNNECYFVNTTIGKDEYSLIIDTGSAYLWVYGSDCDDSPCETEALYTATEIQSSTSTFALAYVTGTASGTIVEDNIIVNKLATTQKFKFGKASTVPDFFGDYPISGIFGLPSSNSDSIESIIFALYDSHAIGVLRFSVSIGELNENDSTNFPNAGLFAIGSPIKELYNGEIYYTDVIENPSHYWLIALDQILINGHQVEFTDPVEFDSVNSSTTRTAIVDSGTTVLALPKQDALDIHSYFENSVTDGSNFAIYCNSTLIITLDINGTQWEIGPDQYLGDDYSKNSGYYGYCVSNIQGVTTSAESSWILGATFLKTVYADFDVEGQKMGFAERNTNVVLTSTSTTNSGSATTASVSYTSFSTSYVSNHTSSSSSSYNAGARKFEGISFFTLFSSLVSYVLL